LLQHAYNPVDWYPWGEEALERARREDKPIFLSIGYATCHWCHVMEQESFEDPEVAGLMNETFVAVKVDREERPDLDHIYMSVCQMLTGSGGWPTTIVMTPGGRPFFAATYIPKQERFGQAGLLELIPRIRDIWLHRRDEVLHSADQVARALKGLERAGTGEIDQRVLASAYRELAERYDSEEGGFGSAPKFPSPHILRFLLRYWRRSGEGNALEMVEHTLTAMRRGGIYDQLGYGFHRYSTDRKWKVPHFEKMLYDQALLAVTYLEAYQATGNPLFAGTAREVLTYVMRDMTSPEGAFLSAEDADSEGIEGKFYLWEADEIHRVLGKRDAEVIIQALGVEERGNFSEEATGRHTGANILHWVQPPSEVASLLGLTVQELEERWSDARRRLFEAREGREHPYKDNKILLDWNGLMIAALAIATQVTEDPRFVRAAEEAIHFILSRMRTREGRLLHRYREGEAGITAHLDDYAYLIWGLIELYQTTFETRYLETALELNHDMLTHYLDTQDGALSFSPDDGEQLVVRNKVFYDGATPSGNSVALENLIRLARLTGKSTLEETAWRLARAFAPQVDRVPSGYTHFLVALDFAFGPSQEVVIVGPGRGRDTLEMLKALRSRFIPNQVVILKPSEETSPRIEAIADFIRSYKALEGKATAYVCREGSCSAPTTDKEEMLAELT